MDASLIRNSKTIGHSQTQLARLGDLFSLANLDLNQPKCAPIRISEASGRLLTRHLGELDFADGPAKNVSDLEFAVHRTRQVIDNLQPQAIGL